MAYNRVLEDKERDERLKARREKLVKKAAGLPEPCEPFLLDTGTEMAITTRLAYADELRWFFEFLISSSPTLCDMEDVTEMSLGDITSVSPQDVSRYLTYMRDRGKGERTLARKRAALSRFYKYLVTNREAEFNPVAAAVNVKVHQSDEVLHLDFSEQDRLLEAVDTGDTLTEKEKKYHARYQKRDLALITLLLDTGMRVSELNGANVQDVDLDRKSVRVTRKGGNVQTLYFSDEEAGLLKDYLDSRSVHSDSPIILEPLFTTLKGQRLSVRAIEVLVKKYCSSAIPGKGAELSPHKMRSSFAMGFYEETKDILALQRKLGHKNLAATNVYAKATDRKMEETRDVAAEGRRKAMNDDEGIGEGQ